MSNKINYNSEEVSEAKTIIKESIRILQSDILSPLNSDFKALSEVDLFSSGLSKIQMQMNTLANDHNTFLNALGDHDSDMSDFESRQADAVSKYLEGSSSEGSYYGGSNTHHKHHKSKDKNDGDEISDKELKEIVDNFSYDNKLQALKNLLTYDDLSVTSLLTDESNSNILSCLLKQMLNDSSAEINDNPSKYEKLIQETLLESIASDDNNVFVSLNENSFLQGMSYLKQVASSNKIDVSSLILDDKYGSILLSSIKDMYNNPGDAMLTSYESNGVKSYIDNISKNNNISVDTLLSDTKYLKLIKGGNS